MALERDRTKITTSGSPADLMELAKTLRKEAAETKGGNRCEGKPSIHSIGGWDPLWVLRLQLDYRNANRTGDASDVREWVMRKAKAQGLELLNIEVGRRR